MSDQRPDAPPGARGARALGAAARRQQGRNVPPPADGLHAPEELLPRVYDELRKLATSRLAREGPGPSLHPTALVHEAYLRLARNSGPEAAPPGWRSRAHFFGAAAIAMRRILIERARRQRRARHGAGERPQSIDPDTLPAPDGLPSLSLIDLENALERMEQVDERMSRIVTLRFFGGLTIEETAHALDVSTTTVKREWANARRWLLDELGGADD